MCIKPLPEEQRIPNLAAPVGSYPVDASPRHQWSGADHLGLTRSHLSVGGRRSQMGSKSTTTCQVNPGVVRI